MQSFHPILNFAVYVCSFVCFAHFLYFCTFVLLSHFFSLLLLLVHSSLGYKDAVKSACERNSVFTTQ